MEWLAIPSKLREPATQGQFALKIGVHENTLARWKKLEGFNTAVGELAREQVDEHLPDIYGALVKGAKAGRLGHIKTCLEVAQHYVERRVMHGDNSADPIKVEHSGTVEISEAESKEEQFEKLFAAIDEYRADAHVSDSTVDSPERLDSNVPNGKAT